MTSFGHLPGPLVSALVDGELGHETRDLALAHLAGCPGCRHEVDTERAVVARLRTMGDAGVPADLVRRLREIPVATMSVRVVGRRRTRLRGFAHLGDRTRPRRYGRRTSSARTRGTGPARSGSLAAGAVSMLALGVASAFFLGGRSAQSPLPIVPAAAGIGSPSAPAVRATPTGSTPGRSGEASLVASLTAGTGLSGFGAVVAAPVSGEFHQVYVADVALSTSRIGDPLPTVPPVSPTASPTSGPTASPVVTPGRTSSGGAARPTSTQP
ncbi:MAG: anti-sigma factor family protein [Actinomycetes bacterium]